jgi:pimeloyl-ACP methyl ester carboxylesterase
MMAFSLRCLAGWGGLLALVSTVAFGAQGEELLQPADCSFKAQYDGSTQRYVQLLPPGWDATRSCALLIVLHGHGSDRWQYLRESRGECRAARDIAARRSMILISPDYRATTSWMGPAAEADLLQIITHWRANGRVGKVIVSGASMGGSGALTFAALHPEVVDGVVALNGTANLLEFPNFLPAIEASFGGDKISLTDEYKRRSAEYWPERLTMPLALSAGGQDGVVPPGSVRRLANILTELCRPVLLVWREQGDHSTGYGDALACYEFVVEQVLAR